MNKKAEIYYARLDEFFTKEEKYDFLEKSENLYNIQWQSINPNSKNHWLTDDLEEDFDSFIAMGNKESKSGNIEDAKTIFHQYSLGVSTNRDTWVYNFNPPKLLDNIRRMIETYNYDLSRYIKHKQEIKNIDNFLTNDSTKISWSHILKGHFKRNREIILDQEYLRESIYRPFVKTFLYFQSYTVDARCQFPIILPTPETEKENLIISVAGIGNRKEFGCLVSNHIISLDFAYEKAQCFPYRYLDKKEK